MCIFKWEPITIQDILIFFAILVALFGEKCWKKIEKKSKKKNIKRSLFIPLDRLNHDILRIRDKRNPINSNRSDTTQIIFNEFSLKTIKISSC